MNGSIQDHSVGEDSANTVSESALEQDRPTWVDPSQQRESKSDQSFAEWKRANPSVLRRPDLLPRPKSGTSRKLLLSQIERLEEDKVLLQSRLRALMDPVQPPSSRLRTDEDSQLRPSPAQSSLPQTIASSSNDNTAVDFPSTFAGAYAETDDEGGLEYMEQVVGLAGRLRMALAPNGEDASTSVDGVANTLLDRPELTALLLQSKPHPEKREYYAQVFAKRNLELYKMPKYRSPMLQAGPLQQNVKHPRYVDILAKCLREPFIAHMGKFDEMEFCLWLVITADFHAAEGDDVLDENGELDDSCYEFSETFLQRFPFAGVRQLIDNTNVWRKQRGEEAIIQTEEMKQAEIFTNSMQMEAETRQNSQTSNKSPPRLDHPKDLPSEDSQMEVSEA